MIKNVIFDWGGVINDVFDDALKTINGMFVDLGGKPISKQQLKDEWEQPYMDFYHKFFPDLTLEKQKLLFKKHIGQHKTRKAYKGIKEFLNKLEDANIKTVVLSSDQKSTIMEEVDEYGLRSKLGIIYYDVHDKGSIIEDILKKHHFSKNETLIVGDSIHEIKVGKSAGIKTAAVTWGLSSEKRLKAFDPDYIINNLSDLEKAIF